MLTQQSDSTVLVIFGGGGDLAWRKLVPALFNLHLDNLLPQRFAIVGIARTHRNDSEFRQHLREGVDLFSRRKPANEEIWHRFADHVSYLSLISRYCTIFTSPRGQYTLTSELTSKPEMS
ncbi:MAG: hypothetical protein HIU83_03105, partial [Proteobacteria bacterium]|nr:hypothetical protein [Pseudomonadota bacterium]